METNNTQSWMIASEVELIYKSKVKASERPQINTSKDAYDPTMKINKNVKKDEHKARLL
jgi:hypothetical protein